MNLRKFRNLSHIIFKFLVTSISLKSVKTCLSDKKGGLILPIDGIFIEDKDWVKYQLLKEDKTVKSINSKDLPDEFCEKACDVVDEFHRKTVNETVEWMLCFDYDTGDVIYCWKGEEGKCIGDIDRIHLSGKNIASIHNHTKKYYSFPSPYNFNILTNDFEDYEIITSINSFWIVEFKGSVENNLRENF